MIKILELFGGIGACSKALEKLGIDYEIVDYVEIDKYAVASYNAMHGTNFETQDICEWNKDIEVDLIMHGSPCQDFSLVGKQAGGDEGSGTRSSLMYETIRIVDKLKPKYIIWENVKNVISKKHVHNFNNYINRMSELGYKSFYKVLNAKDYGIPQNRERVFTISILDGLDYEFPKPIPLKLKLKDMLEDEEGDGVDISSRMQYHRGTVQKEMIQTLDSQGGNSKGVVENLRIRKLTPKECWRLMGFDDEDFEKAEKVNSNTQLYKQAGNSIVVNVLYAILKNLLLRKETQKHDNIIKGQTTIYDFLGGNNE